MKERKLKASTKRISQIGGLYVDTGEHTFGTYRFFSGPRHATFGSFVFIQDYNLEADIPAHFDPRPAAVKLLEEHQKRLDAEYEVRRTDLQAQINKLLAISDGGNAQ